MDPRCADPSGEGADLGARRRLPAVVVARRFVDRLHLGSRHRPAFLARPLGSAAAHRDLPRSPGRFRPSHADEARRILRQPDDGRADSRRVVAYCTSAQETMDFRQSEPEGGSTVLLAIDVASGAASDLASGPGVKMAPAFVGGDLGYIRKDKPSGIVYVQWQDRDRRAVFSVPRGRRMAGASPITKGWADPRRRPRSVPGCGAGCPRTN